MIALALPTLKKHQISNKDESIINTPEYKYEDRLRSLGNDLNQWQRELNLTKVNETKIFCEGRIIRIKDKMKKRGYDPENLSCKI